MTANPYLAGNRAPVADEVTALDLTVHGEISVELEGRWLRNGPNPLPDSVDPATHHWFVGEGMVHGVRLRGGQAEWYRNRWIRSAPVAEHLGVEPIEGPSHGRSTGPNTNVGGFAGATWAMVEAGASPVRLGYDLDDQRWDDFDGTLPGPFSAHPKVDPATGEMHAMGYAWPDLADGEAGRIQYVVVGTDGRVRRCIDIAVPDWVMVHDMSLTESTAIVYDFPITVDFEVAMTGQFPFRWNPDRPARLGLLPREADADEIRWVDIDPCFAFHPLNAYDTDDGRIVVDLCRYDKIFDTDVLGPFGDSLATLDRWTIDPVSGQVHTERISDRWQEFPRHAHAVGCREHRYGYTAELLVVADPGAALFGATLKTDLSTGVVTEHDHGPGRGGAEPVFVARDGATAEDDGWLMVLVYDATTDASELVILDATDIAAAPLARVELPHRVPDGFHGNWVSDHSVPPPA